MMTRNEINKTISHIGSRLIYMRSKDKSLYSFNDVRQIYKALRQLRDENDRLIYHLENILEGRGSINEQQTDNEKLAEIKVYLDGEEEESECGMSVWMPLRYLRYLIKRLEAAEK